MTWRERLSAAIERSGKKHSTIAWEAGIAPETLSRVLNGTHARPSFETVAAIAHACGETVGWLLDERPFILSAEERRRVRTVVVILDRALRE